MPRGENAGEELIVFEASHGTPSASEDTERSGGPQRTLDVSGMPASPS